MMNGRFHMSLVDLISLGLKAPLGEAMATAAALRLNFSEARHYTPGKEIDGRQVEGKAEERGVRSQNDLDRRSIVRNLPWSGQGRATYRR